MPHSKGFRQRRDERSTGDAPIGEIVAGLLREPLFSRGMAVARLAAEWSSVVGPRLASETAPTGLERGVLTLAASTGPWGAQARFLVDEIRRRANEALGDERIRTVRVVVRPDPSKAL
jgi:predicted nucleic acid-binding Zn ribbon protein